MPREKIFRPFSQLGPIAIRYGLEHPTASYKEIEEAVGLAPTTLKVAVCRLKAAGTLPPEWLLRPGPDVTPKPWPKPGEEPPPEEPKPPKEEDVQPVWKRAVPLVLAPAAKTKTIIVAPTISQKASVIIDRLADYLMSERVDAKAYANVVTSFRGMVQDFGSIQQYQKATTATDEAGRTSLRDQLLGEKKARSL